MAGSIFQKPELFGVTEAPRSALVNLLAGQTALLARLDDEDLDSIGLSAEHIVSNVRSDDAFLPEERKLVEQVWVGVRSNDCAWIPAFVALLSEDEGWRDLASLHWCLRNPFFDEYHLASGPLGTLANTLLELAQLQATVGEVQATYSEIASGIASGKLSGTEEGLAVAGNLVLGGVVGWFTAGAGTPAAMKAASWIDDQLRKVDAWVLDLALECVVATTLEGTRPEVHRAIARKIFAEASGLSDRAAGSASDQQQRMLLNAYRGLTGEAGLPEHVDGVPLPDFEGQTLKQAKRYLESLGLPPPFTVDVGQPESPRSVWDDAGWVVCGQRPEAGTPSDEYSIVLAYSRPAEVVRALIMAKQLDEAEKLIRG